MNQLRIFPTNYFVLNLLNIIIRFMNDVIWLLHDHVVTLFLTVRSIYKFFFFRRIGFYFKQKICLRFGVSNIHSLLDMIYFNVKHLLKIWNVYSINVIVVACLRFIRYYNYVPLLFNMCESRSLNYEKKWFALHSVLITC